MTDKHAQKPYLSPSLTYLFAGVLASLFSFFNALWLLQQNSTFSFDSSRFFTKSLYLKSVFLEQGIQVLLNEIVRNPDPLWLFIQVFFCVLFKPISIKSLIWLNSFFGLLSLSLSFCWLSYRINKNDQKFSPLLPLLACISTTNLMNSQKVLLPELYSFSLLLFFLGTLSNYLKNFSIKNLSIILLCLILAPFLNRSTMIMYPFGFLCIFFIHLFRNTFQSKRYYSLLSLVTFLFLVALYFYYPNLVAPDNIQSWTNTDHIKLSTKVFWGIFGFIEKCTGPINFFVILYIGINYLDKKKFTLILCSFIGVFLTLSWLSPSYGRDFYVTGYRYSLLLTVIASLVFTLQFKYKFNLLLFLILFNLSQFIYTSLPKETYKDWNLSARIFPIDLAQKWFNWNGRIRLFDFSNSIISGGSESRLDKKSRTKDTTVKIIEIIKHHANPNSSNTDFSKLWISGLDSLQNLTFSFQNEITRNNFKYCYLVDFKNVLFPTNLKSQLLSLKASVPLYQPLNLVEIFLHESDFIWTIPPNCIESLEIENEMRDIYFYLYNYFESIKSLFKKVSKIKINDSQYVEIYRKRNLPFRTLLEKNLRNNSTSIKPSGYFFINDFSYPSNFVQDLTKMDKRNLIKRVNIHELNLINPEKSILIIPDYIQLSPETISHLSMAIQKGFSLMMSPSNSENKKGYQYWPLNPALNFYFGLNCQKAIPTKPTTLKFHTNVPGVKKIDNLNKLQTNEFSHIQIETGLRADRFNPTRGNIFPNRNPCGRQFNLMEIYNGQKKILSFANLHYFKTNQLDGKDFNYLQFFITHAHSNWNSLLGKKNTQSYLNYLDKILFNEIFLYEAKTKVKNNKNILALTFFNQSNEVNPSFKLRATINDRLLEEITIPKLQPGKNSLNIEIKNSVSKHTSVELSSTSKLVVLDQDFLLLPPKAKSKNLEPFNNDKFLQGVNYYPSSNYDQFWSQPDFKEIYDDFHLMKSMNINYVRMHFAHLEWYKNIYLKASPNNKKNNQALEDPIKTLLFIFDLSYRLNIRLCIDLFSLVGPNMGSSHGWHQDYSRFLEPKFLNQQNNFLVSFLMLTQNYSHFDIDLINEPGITPDNYFLLRKWSQEKVKIIKTIRPDIPVTIGTKKSLPLDFDLDFQSFHGYQFPTKYNSKLSFQEFWPIKKREKRNIQERLNRIKSNLIQSKNLKLHSFLVWSFKEPQNLSYHLGIEESWEKSLGSIVNSNGCVYGSNIFTDN